MTETWSLSRLYTDFSKRDYTSNFERLLSILTMEVPELTDRNHSDAGISIIRLLARQTDMLSFYVDEVFAEGFVETAKFRQSLIDLATIVDCRPKLASCASCTVTVTKYPDYASGGSTPSSVTIPQYTQFSRSDGVTYICMDEIQLPIGVDSASFDVYQLERVAMSVAPGDFEYIQPYKRLRLNIGSNVVSDFFTMYDFNSSWYWTYVDSFYRSLPGDTHFSLELFADSYNGVLDSVFLTVGDGIYGSDIIPKDVRLNFFTTLGPEGNCGVGMITNVLGSSLSNFITCTNITQATGGALPESTEAFRARIPRVVQTQRRGVTEADYEALIESIPGVLDCQAVSRSSNVSWPYMYVFLYVLPDGGGTISQFLRDKIVSQCNLWGHMGDWGNRYVVLDTIPQAINVSIRVGITQNVRQSVVTSGINTALNNFFLPENQMIGRPLRFADIHRAISTVNGVDWVEFSSPTGTITATEGCTYILGSVSINYGS